MDSTMIAIFLGFIGVGIVIGWPIGAALERRYFRAEALRQYQSALDREAAGRRPPATGNRPPATDSVPAPVRAARERLDAILDATILEEK